MQDRLDKLMQILARRGYRSVSDLAQDLRVSEMTVRRYLDRLEQKSLITRTHGGAYTGLEMIEVDYRVRETVRQAEKEAIGKVAFSLIRPGESVFIDAGSTAAFLALAVDDTKRITVVTSSLVVAQALENRTSVETILLGGRIHSGTHSVVGPLAEEAIRPFRFTKAFLGTSGINLAEGLTQSTIEEIPVKKLVAANAKEVYVLADSSKLHRDVLVLFLTWEHVHGLITDAGISAADRAALEEKGIRVLVAEPIGTASGIESTP